LVRLWSRPNNHSIEGRSSDRFLRIRVFRRHNLGELEKSRQQSFVPDSRLFPGFLILSILSIISFVHLRTPSHFAFCFCFCFCASFSDNDTSLSSCGQSVKSETDALEEEPKELTLNNTDRDRHGRLSLLLLSLVCCTSTGWRTSTFVRGVRSRAVR
jgi:hypothetical protein